MGKFNKYFPIYINTLNIFKPLKTWLYNIYLDIIPHNFLNIKFEFYKGSFDIIKEKFYTWYWWDHPYIWNFNKKWIIILIDDVQYKYTYGMRQLESVPFIYIKLFKYNLLITFNAPKYFNNYEYWEKLNQ
jgi:hypothetical protein